MKAAIYVRKSTDQRDRDDAEKSVAHQERQARAFIAAKGWTVVDGAVFVDDGISGAEFAKRRGLAQLLNTLARPPFAVLVMADESRLGRESIETSFVLKQIVQAGVRVFFYQTDSERTLDGPMDKVMLALSTFAADMERAKAQERARDKHGAKFRDGHVVGGIIFGYRNEPVLGASGKKSHVVRVVEPAQAAVVVTIFERYAAGRGFVRIAKQLNADGAPSPRPMEDKPPGWSPSSVRSILKRELYRGVETWNRTQKRDTWGRQRQTARPSAEWQTRELPELRIVSDALWSAVQLRFVGRHATVDTATGKRAIVRRDLESAYLLSGFGRCATCGWSMTIVTRQHGKARKPFLGCLSYHKRGSHVCPNAQVVPLEKVDLAVLMAVRVTALAREAVSRTLDEVFRGFEPPNLDAELATLHEQRAAVEQSIANLTSAIEASGGIDSLIAKLRARHQEREDLVVRIATVEGNKQASLDRATIEARVDARLDVWRQQLQAVAETQTTAFGRQLLREVLTGPLVFTPDGEGYTFRAPSAVGDVIAGAVADADGVTVVKNAKGRGGPHKVASPAGFEPAFWP